MDNLTLPASFSSLGGCCTQLSTLPQFQVKQWIESQLASCLPQNSPPPSTPPISHEHSLKVHLQTCLVTPSACISEFTAYWPPSAWPNSLDHSLKVRLWVDSNLSLPVHLRVYSILASKCISKLTRSGPPSASSTSIDHGLQVHLSVHSISASEGLTKLARSQPASI